MNSGMCNFQISVCACDELHCDKNRHKVPTIWLLLSFSLCFQEPQKEITDRGCSSKPTNHWYKNNTHLGFSCLQCSKHATNYQLGFLLHWACERRTCVHGKTINSRTSCKRLNTAQTASSELRAQVGETGRETLQRL